MCDQIALIHAIYIDHFKNYRLCFTCNFLRGFLNEEKNRCNRFAFHYTTPSVFLGILLFAANIIQI